MLDQVLKVFEMSADIDLNIMKPEQDLFDVTSEILLGMRKILKKYKPNILLVHGDTSSTFASALAAFYVNIPVCHIEAGLRTHDLLAPFPEEFNRQATTKLSKWHFTPTESSKKNLLHERIPEAMITVTGNTVIDSLFWVLRRINEDAERSSRLNSFLNQQLNFNWKEKRFVLVTGHRRENFGDGFLHICYALKDLAAQFPDVQFVYPVHLNPNVQNPVNEILKNLHNVQLIAPFDYEPFIYLLKHCYIVLTDSGGIQEEAPSLGKPVLVMRDVTERPEAVDAGTVRLVGANRSNIVANITELLNNPCSYASMSRAHNPYGDGHACERIISVLKGI
jgi:UDP-N-acetylglucosamine 2-epimerase (non-hydrolysing)